MIRDKFYINGQWQVAAGQNFIDVLNPATEAVIGKVAAGNNVDVDHAVQAASDALPGWSATNPAERGQYLRKIHVEMQSRASEIAELICDEMGMPIKMCQRIQAGLPIAVTDSYAQLLDAYEFTEQIGNSKIYKEPVGVVAAITPWNFPLHQLVIKVAAALAAGCTIVVKPSEIAPFNAFLLAEIVAACELPAGVFNLLCGSGRETGEALVSHPQVDMVSFTGSTRAGKRVSVLAADSIKRVALELGGKSAAILLDDADVTRAVKATVNSCFLNAGQTCSALTRLLVPEKLYSQVAAQAVDVAKSFQPGSPRDELTKLGPVVSAEQKKRVQECIQSGIDEGAELLTGGVESPASHPSGYYVQPTIFGRVTASMRIAQEEIFGPVLSIVPYRDEEDAINIANATCYGLAGAVWSADVERAERVAKKLRTGQVDINGGRFNLLAPFGGYRQSGNGRELGHYGLEEFLEIKSLQF